MKSLNILCNSKKFFSHLGYLKVSYVLIVAAYTLFVVQYVVFNYSSSMIQDDRSLKIDEFSRTSKAFHVIEETEKLFDDVGLNESINYLDDQINLVTDVRQKSIFSMERAVLYLNSEIYDMSLDSAQSAVLYEKSDSSYALLARIYEKTGDYNKAIENYNYAIYYSDIKLSDVSADVVYYKTKIDELRAKYE